MPDRNPFESDQGIFSVKTTFFNKYLPFLVCTQAIVFWN